MKKTLKILSISLALSTILTAFASEITEPIYAIRDDCSNFLKMDQSLTTSDNIAIATSNQGWANGDNSRMYKKSHEGDSDSATYVTYQRDEPITYFKIVGGHRKLSSKYPVFLIDTSTDGKSFTPFVYVSSKQSAAVEWANNTITSLDWTPEAPLPENTHYIRVRFGETRSTGFSNTDIQLMKAFVSVDDSANTIFENTAKETLNTTVNSAEIFIENVLLKNPSYSQEQYNAINEKIIEAKELILNGDSSYTQLVQCQNEIINAVNTFKLTIEHSVPFFDSCESLDYLHESNNVKAVDSSLPGISDNARIAKNSYESAYIVYRFNEGIKYFNAEVALGKVGENLPEDMTFAVSSDGIDYIDIDVVRTELNYTNTDLTSGQFRIFANEGSNIPEEAKFLKIVFADTTGLNTYCNQLVNVAVNNNNVNIGKIIAVDNRSDLGLSTKESLGMATDVTVKTTITKTTDENMNVIVIASIFDGDSLITMKTKMFDFQNAECIIDGLNITETLNDPYIKLFVWDSVGLIRPLSFSSEYLK